MAVHFYMLTNADKKNNLSNYKNFENRLRFDKIKARVWWLTFH